MKRVLVISVVLAVAGCAHPKPADNPLPVAELGQLADSAITHAAISSGQFAEANPLFAGLIDGSVGGTVAGAAIKLTLVEAVKLAPHDNCVPLLQALTGAGWGATVANVATLAGAPFGAAIPLYLLTAGVTTWKAKDYAAAACPADDLTPARPIAYGYCAFSDKPGRCSTSFNDKS